MRTKITAKNELRITFDNWELDCFCFYVNEVQSRYKEDLPTTEILNLIQVLNKLYEKVKVYKLHQVSINITASECSSLIQAPLFSCSDKIAHLVRQVTQACDSYLKNSYNIVKINRTLLNA